MTVSVPPQSILKTIVQNTRIAARRRSPRHSRMLLAGIQCCANYWLLYSALALDSRMRGNDGGWVSVSVKIVDA
jgi:hypothetical protein